DQAIRNIPKENRQGLACYQISVGFEICLVFAFFLLFLRFLGILLFNPCFNGFEGLAGKKTQAFWIWWLIKLCHLFILQLQGLPYALNQAGLPLGLVLLIAVACITDYSIVLLIKGGNLSGSNSYQSLVQSTFGFPGYLILSVLQFLYPFIAMISYNITTGDTLTKVFQRIPGGRRTLHAYRWINASFCLMDVIFRVCL
uniref:Putative sodium-coupled neutral amino acid transporter 11 n=1 Tax=Oryzias sinensis TaxID=183150 RepID=A0A8C7Z984_9TELE